MHDLPEGLDGWIEQACAAVQEDPATIDVHALLGLASAAAHSGLRPLAPVACAIWGLACTSHPTRPEAQLHEVLVQAFTSFGQTGQPADELQVWKLRTQQACASVDVDPAAVDIERVQSMTRRVAHATARPMAPVTAHLWGRAVGRGQDGERAARALASCLAC